MSGPYGPTTVARRMLVGVMMLLAVATTLAMALALPTSALAAKHDQLSVNTCGHPGPCPASNAVTRGQLFRLYLKGYAVSPANAILSFADTSPCPSVYSVEANRARAHQAAYLGASVSPVPGRFGTAWVVFPTKSASMPLGNDYVCSYLKHLTFNPRRVTKPTYAHASATLTVKP